MSGCFSRSVILSIFVCLFICPGIVPGGEGGVPEKFYSQDVMNELALIRAKIEQNQTVIALNDLYLLIGGLPDFTPEMRMAIQDILLASVSNKDDIAMEEALGDVFTNATYLTMHFFEKRKMPECSYENAVCCELRIILLDAINEYRRAVLDEALSSTAAGKIDFDRGMAQMEDAAEKLKAAKDLKVQSTELAISTLADGENDDRAKIYLWGLTNRLLGGGPYWADGGIEGLENSVADLRKAYEAEKNLLVLATAKITMTNLDALLDSK